MNRLFNRPLIATLSAFFLCFQITDVSGISEIETAENITEALPWQELIDYSSDDMFLSRIHNASIYHLVAFSDTGEVIQLHDASKWFVNPDHSHLVLQWVQNDSIVIKPKYSCFSSYRYVLHNRTTQQAVEVNLKNPPLPMEAYTLRIVNIEPYQRLVLLSDNTVWQIDPFDTNFLYWQIGQRVLIGVNNHWRTTQHPQILINVDFYQEPYSQAIFYGYPIAF